MKYTINDIVFDIMNGDLKSVKSKIKAHSELLNYKDKFERTLLMEAAIHAKVDIARFFVEQGIDVNVQDKNGWSALHFAVQSSSCEIIHLLIDNGANVDVQERYGNTPLMRAVLNSNKRGDIIPLLLAAGADRDIKNDGGYSPYSLAQQITNHNIIQYFS